MEHPSQLDDTLESRAVLQGQLRESYGRVVYSHKTHEKAADILLARLGRIKLAQILLSAVTTAGLITAVLTSLASVTIVSAIVSAALLVLNFYTKEEDLGASAQRHRQAATDLWLIRESYLSLITDLRISRSSFAKILDERDDLVRQLHAIYEGAPSTNPRAYKQAQRALKVAQDMSFSDAEIDSMLPRELRLVKAQ